jgi:hypothetical protein
VYSQAIGKVTSGVSESRLFMERWNNLIPYTFAEWFKKLCGALKKVSYWKILMSPVESRQVGR